MQSTLQRPRTVAQCRPQVHCEFLFPLGRDAEILVVFSDAILVSDSGPVYGRHAIEKYYAEHFREVRYVKHETTDDPASVRSISADGNVIWENGEWTGTLFLQGEDCGPTELEAILHQ